MMLRLPSIFGILVAMWIIPSVALGQSVLGQKAEFRLGGTAQIGKQNMLLLDEVATGDAVLSGVDVFAAIGWVGIRARLQGGPVSGSSGIDIGDFARGEVNAVVGSRQIAVEVGYGRRALNGPRSARALDYGRGGLALMLPIGASGIVGRLAGGALVGAGQDSELSGLDLETAVLWLPARIPAYLSVGYRYEQLTVSTGDSDRPEEIGGLQIGIGLRLRR